MKWVPNEMNSYIIMAKVMDTLNKKYGIIDTTR